MSMSDWREMREVREQDIPSKTEGEKLSSRGIEAMQGNVDAQGSKVSGEPDKSDDWITIHPHKNPETLPSPEVEPVPVKNPEGGKPKPPEGWRPGGLEGGG